VSRLEGILLNVKKHLFVLSMLAAASSAAAAPLTRYFPDFPLAVFEAKDLQEAVKATGEFGEETQRFLGTLLNDSLKTELGSDLPPLLRDLTVRTMVASIKDVALAGYTVRNEPQLLMAIRFTPDNPISKTFAEFFTDVIKDTPPKQRIREGNYIAVNDGVAAGLGNNIFYLSTNADLLRSYLRRLNGQNLPVVANNPNFISSRNDVGDGFLSQYINFTSVAQWLGRDPIVPKKFTNALRTLNVNASVSSIVPDGMDTKTVLQLNERGGDAALLKLLTYTPAQLELLRDLPDTAPSAAVLATDTAGWLDYIGSWLPELEFGAEEQKDLLAAFGRLKDRLGNEWAVVGSSQLDPSSALTTFGLGSALSGLGGLLSPDNLTTFYGKTKDGAQALTDLETAIQTELNQTPTPAPDGKTPPQSTKTTLERSIIAGLATLHIKNTTTTDGKSTEQNIYIVNKNNTIVIGTNRDNLEKSLAANPLLELPAFKGISFPARVSGVSYTAPIRLSKAEFEKMLGDYVKAFELDGEVPENILTATSDWLESWSNRTQVGFGHMVSEGNKLTIYGKSGFTWNK
jgi:hypothetical protein